MKYFYRILLILALILSFASCKKEDQGGKKEETKYTVSGTVKGSDGAALAGVVVSDGHLCVKTDANGQYRISSNLDEMSYIIVTTPSLYKAPVEQGLPIFFKRKSELKKDADGIYSNVDFVLDKIDGDPSRYTLFISADPQPRSSSATYDNFAFHSLDCCEDLYKDWRETAATITDRPVYGIVLGDIVHENMTLFKKYREGLARNGYATYNVMGNHDHDLDTEGSTGGSNMIGTMSFEKNFGPRNYSMELGNIHVVVMDDIYVPYKDGKWPKGDYGTGFTERDWQWLRNDLSLVDRSKTIMFCAHSVIFRTAGGSERGVSAENHRSDVAHLLGKFAKCHAWFGHGHNTFNFVYPETDKYYQYFKNVEVHMVARSTGQLWTNEVLTAGTPRGYTIVEVNGDDVSWKFHPVRYQSSKYVGTSAKLDRSLMNFQFEGSEGYQVAMRNGKPLDESYQMNVYGPGAYENDNYVYANVFLWDSKWEKPVWTPDGGASSTMTLDNRNTYDWFMRKIVEHYQQTTSLGSADYSYTKDVHTIFSAYVNPSSGIKGGTVSVTDRFGNKYSTHISW